jgi:hypothetical protein
MKFTAYITRFYQMAEESLEVIIDDIPDFEDFKERVFNVLRVTDYRANLQARRLFEDTELIKELSYSDLQKIRKAVDILFPQMTLPKTLDLNSSQSWNEEERKGKGGYQFTKSLRDGEVLKIFLHEVEPEEDSQVAIKNIYSIIDARLRKTNQRNLDFTNYLRSLDMDMRTKITMILELLYRQTDVATVIQRLKGQEAQETVEQIRADIQEQSNAS